MFDKDIFKDYPDVMSVEDISKALMICDRTAYKLIKEGKIQCLKIGRTFRIPKVYCQ